MAIQNFLIMLSMISIGATFGYSLAGTIMVAKTLYYGYYEECKPMFAYVASQILMFLIFFLIHGLSEFYVFVDDQVYVNYSIPSKIAFALKLVISLFGVFLVYPYECGYEGLVVIFQALFAYLAICWFFLICFVITSLIRRCFCKRQGYDAINSDV
jgi:hypothetical protein